MIVTKGIDHLTLTVKDVQKSKQFYQNICGMKVIADEKEYVGLTDDTFSLWIGTSRDYAPKEQRFDRNFIGLDHWAFKVTSMSELREIENELQKLSVLMEDGGITDDDFGGKAIFTQDPDGMKVEFHLRE